MFAALGRFTYRRRWSVLLAGLVFILVGAIYGTDVFSSVKTGGFIDPNSESTKAAKALHQHLGRDEGVFVVLFSARDASTVDSPEYKQAVEATLAKIDGKPGVGNIFTFYNTGLPQLVSADRRSTYAAVGLSGDDDTQVRHIKQLRPLIASDRLEVRVGGRPAVYAELTEQVEKDLRKAELMSFPIVGILLVLIFGSLVASALPLAIGGTAILGAFLILRIVSNFADVSVFSLNLITMLGFGLAIDYSLFVVSRFREELLCHDGNVPAALVTTMQTAGHTVLFSGLTVVISLLSLLVFAPMFLKSMGFGAAMAVLVAMVAALTILPAILAILGERVNLLSIRSLIGGKWARSRTTHMAEEAYTGQNRFWYRISHFVMRHPATVLVLTLVPLIGVGLPFFRINFSVFDARSLPHYHESRAVNEILTQQFPRNETVPIELVVRTAKPALDATSLSALYDYTREVAAIPGVRRVDSLVTLDPRLDKAAYAAFYSDANRTINPLAAQAAQRFANGNYTAVSVIYDSDPYSLDSREIVRNIRSLDTPSSLRVQVGGEPAYLVDFLSSLGDDLPVAFGLIAAVMFVLLFLMLGSLVMPFKAIVLNILSLSVSFGLLVWGFQDGHLARLLSFTSVGSVDAAQPVLMFAGAFGLSMDYQVFLLSRIKEEYDRTKDMKTAVAWGVQKTGGIITSAAVLLAVVIGSFAAGEVLFIKQIGVGLAVAILVDATIVRTLLVPATMQMLGRYNWWAPHPLSALYHRLQLGEAKSIEPTVKTIAD